jgi:hypothetical protein
MSPGNGRSPGSIDGPHAGDSSSPPTTEPSPAAKNPATPSPPWEAAASRSEKRSIRPPIRWIIGGRWTERVTHSTRVWTVVSVRHGAKTSTSTGHGTHSPWSSSIKPWHENTSSPQSANSRSLAASRDLQLQRPFPAPRPPPIPKWGETVAPPASRRLPVL